jgi:hypothetical protein
MCDAIFNKGSSVKLTATTAGQNVLFHFWKVLTVSGSASSCSASATCVIQMGANTSVVANFQNLEQ